ncbi:dehydrogenase/reductase SDR family member on chromosome X [Tetranychus urticae]|uniref:Uncharacterized protein n=1 Tax=Tetranychus urticae TaxID=32264 RepID=T1JZU9_TETUR|nr:dehydrogenase/reductase SDR family member on chromosome X [Tetranychus urticae]
MKEEKSGFQNVIHNVYNLWCFICLYLLGAYYVIIELNRKFGFINKVKTFDVDSVITNSLEGRVCIITGGGRGIGWETARSLIKKGYHVIVTSSAKPGSQLDALKAKLSPQVDGYSGKLDIWHLELSSLTSVIEFIKKFRGSGLGLNLLINNAGIMFAPFALTEDGFESHLSINYLGHCLLIWAFLPILNETGFKSRNLSRIVNVSSSTHYARNLRLDDLNGLKLYSPYHAYAQSKLAQIMFTFKLHRYLNEKGSYDLVTVNSVHPGVAKTALYEHVWWVQLFPSLASMVFRTPKEGAETVLYAALSPEVDGVGGKYFEDCAIVRASKYSYDESKQEELWSTTRSLLKPWLEQVEINAS